MRPESSLTSFGSRRAYGFPLWPRAEHTTRVRQGTGAPYSPSPAGRGREKDLGRPSTERGAALVIVLLAVTLLTVAVVEFTYSAQVDHHLTDNALKALQASYLARSGVNLALLALKKDT